MFDIVFVYLRVIFLVIMSEWMSCLCTFVHELREAHTSNPKVNSVNLVGYFGSVWIKIQICYNLVRWKCAAQHVQLLRAAQSYQ